MDDQLELSSQTVRLSVPEPWTRTPFGLPAKTPFGAPVGMGMVPGALAPAAYPSPLAAAVMPRIMARFVRVAVRLGVLRATDVGFAARKLMSDAPEMTDSARSD